MPTFNRGHIHDPGPLIAAAPSLLSYTPGETAALVSSGDTAELMVIAVAELGDVARDEEIALRLIRRVRSELMQEVLVLVISAAPRTEFVQLIARTAAAGGLTVSGLVSATGVRPPASWTCCCGCGRSGPVPELDIEVAASAVLAGIRPYDSYADLAATITPVHADVLTRRGQLLSAAAVPTPGRARDALDRALEAHSHSQRELSDSTVLALHRGLTDQRVAIEVLLEQTSAMRLLLEAGVRGTPRPWRAAPTAYLVLAALLTGEGALAQVVAAHQMPAGAELGPAAVFVDMLASECPPPAEIRRRLSVLI